MGIVNEKTVCDSQFPRMGGTLGHGGPWEAPGPGRGQGGGEGRSLYCGFHEKRQARESKQAQAGPLNNFSGLWVYSPSLRRLGWGGGAPSV